MPTFPTSPASTHLLALASSTNCTSQPTRCRGMCHVLTHQGSTDGPVLPTLFPLLHSPSFQTQVPPLLTKKPTRCHCVCHALLHQGGNDAAGAPVHPRPPPPLNTTSIPACLLTRCHGVCHMLLHQSSADGQATRERLGQRHDIRLYAIQLIAPQLACTGRQA